MPGRGSVAPSSILSTLGRFHSLNNTYSFHAWCYQPTLLLVFRLHGYLSLTVHLHCMLHHHFCIHHRNMAILAQSSSSRFHGDVFTHQSLSLFLAVTHLIHLNIFRSWIVPYVLLQHIIIKLICAFLCFVWSPICLRSYITYIII